jgi:hypothetical protein
MNRRFLTSFALALGSSLPVHAQPLERGALRLDWSSPGGCPNGAEIAERIEALLGAPIADVKAEPIVARGKVTELGPLRYELELETRQRDQRFVRSMQAPSCAELGDAGALVLALAIDPTLAERRARAQTSPGTEALPSDLPPPAQPAPAEPAEPAPAEPAPPAPARPRGAVTTLDSPDPQDEVVPAAPLVVRWSARLGLVLDAGTVANSAYGFGARIGAPFGSFRAELGLVWLPPTATVIATDPERGGSIDLLAADLVGCYVPLRGGFEIAACGIVELGRIHGAGFGTVVESEDSALWVAVGPGALFRLRAAESLLVTASTELLFALERNEFTLENVGTVHQVWPAIPRIGLAVETEFY